MGATSKLKKIRKFGLIGKTLKHSFSKSFFTKKFKEINQIQNSYQNFEFQTEKDLADFLLEEVFSLSGFNITNPYKESIIPYLDEIEKEAKIIRAVNTVFIKNNKLIGYNTDVYGFSESLRPLLKKGDKKALVLGTGGASKSIAYVLSSIGIVPTFISRNPENGVRIHYDDLNKDLMEANQIIVNCTPIGTMPNSEKYPDIPYQYINETHLVYDLVYNPEKTKFLLKAEKQGARIQNGLKMLQLQAEKSWEIWNS